MTQELPGDEWQHADDKPRAATVSLQVRTREQQQAWLDEQYIKRRIGLKEWRFQFDLLSFLNGDGSFPEAPEEIQ